MSSRALRKAQREREEQERLKNLEQDGQEESSEDEVQVQPVKKSAFAMLEEDNEDDDDDEDADQDNGVLLGDEHQHSVSKQPEEVLKSTTSNRHKKKKKKKTKVAKHDASKDPQTNDEGLDEIDIALRELSTNGNASTSGTTTAGVSANIDESSRLLTIDSSHLHSQNEMRRLFGRAALEHQDEDEQPQQQPANVGGNRRQQRRVQQVGLAEALRGRGAPGGRAGGLAATALRRNIFVQGKEEWPQASAGGLGMEIEEKRADGTVLYRFVHNRIYRDVQAQFQIAVESMDPNRLVVLLQHNPYHISTLLQVSEIAKQERDHATSGDLLTRALFSFGRAIHSTFSKNLAEGKARLDFRHAENREFWLAAWRYMQNMSMRALWRTVYEWAKLLLSLAPEDDPYAMWLVLDQFALRARQDLDYLNISRNALFKERLSRMPNVLLSQGLAEYRAGNKSKGQQTLFTAVGRYPWVVARLMQELGLQPPPGVWGKDARTEKEKLYTELYATCAKDIWNTPENSALLTEISSALPPDLPSADLDNTEIQENEARYVLLSDTPALIALIPKHYTNALMSSSDPLPPQDSYPSYLPADLTQRPARPRAAEGGTAQELLREVHTLQAFFGNLFPWFGQDMAAGQMPNAEHFDPERINERIRESGVDMDVLEQRTVRMTELQTRLRDEFGVAGFDFIPGVDDLGGEAEEDEEGNRQPRVEDGEDSDD